MRIAGARRWDLVSKRKGRLRVLACIRCLADGEYEARPLAFVPSCGGVSFRNVQLQRTLNEECSLKARSVHPHIRDADLVGLWHTP